METQQIINLQGSKWLQISYYCWNSSTQIVISHVKHFQHSESSKFFRNSTKKTVFRKHTVEEKDSDGETMITRNLPNALYAIFNGKKKGKVILCHNFLTKKYAKHPLHSNVYDTFYRDIS